MSLKTLKDLNLKEKTVIFRTAYDVPIEKKGDKVIITDDERIKSSISTLDYLVKKQCKIVILTWLKRPGGKVIDDYKLDPIAMRLQKLSGHKIKKLNNCIGKEVEQTIRKMKFGEIVMLENVRFYPGEENNDKDFSKNLANLADFVVFDAFAHSHRDCPSVTGIMSLLPSVAGLSMQKEVETFKKILQNPKRPFLAIVGGAKISDKIEALKKLVKIADAIIIGGAMAYSFLKNQGVEVGVSLVEDKPLQKQGTDVIKVAKQLLRLTTGQTYKANKNLIVPKIILPIDLIAAQEIDKKSAKKIIKLYKGEQIPEQWNFLDIGPKTIEYYKTIINSAKTVFWNGPLGYFELDVFANGTKKIAQSVSNSKSYSIVAGGDTETIVSRYNLEGRFDHVSNGGGAALDFIAGKKLPALKYLIK